MTPALLTAALLVSAPAAQLGASFDGVESGSGRFDPPPAGVYDNPPESGSGVWLDVGDGVIAESGSFLQSLESLRFVPEAGSEIEAGSGAFGGRPDPFAEQRTWGPGVVAPPPRPRDGYRSDELGGGFEENDLPPREPGPPPPGDARVHALLVSLGWIAALMLGAFAGYLAGLSRGDDRRRKSLEPRQMDLAGEIAETADSLMAAADADEPGRYQACVDRLRERVGRTAVLLDDRSAGAVRELVGAATEDPAGERGARLQTAYDGLLAALRKSVRGG